MQVVEALEQAREEKQHFRAIIKEKETEIKKLSIQVKEQNKIRQLLKNKATKPALIKVSFMYRSKTHQNYKMKMHN